MTTVISIATFMEILDASITNVSLHNIAGNLGVSQDQITWIVTSYLIANAIIIPISGFFAHAIGRKRYFMISIALFSAASFLSAISPNLGFLILSRVLQGIGGGGLAPVEQSMLADSFPPEKRGQAFAAFGIVVVIAPIFGPTIGGYITDQWSWHWIFLINVPIGAIALFLVSVFVREPDILIKEREERLRKGLRIDYVGFILLAIGLAGLLLTLDRGEIEGWFSSQFIIATSAFAVIGLGAMIIWEWRHPEPIVPIRLLKNRNFAITVSLMLILGVLIFGTIQIIPQMLQQIYDYTPALAGLALTVGGVATLLTMPAAGLLVSRADPRALLAPAFAMQAIAFWYFSQFSVDATFGHAAFGRFLMSVALPFIFIPINTVAYIGLDPRETDKASAMLNFFRNIGGGFGISLVQTLLVRRAQFHQSRLTETLNDFNPAFVDALHRLGGVGGPKAALAHIYAETQRQASMLAYNDVFHVLFVMIAVFTPFILILRTRDARKRAVPETAPAAA